MGRYKQSIMHVQQVFVIVDECDSNEWTLFQWTKNNSKEWYELKNKTWKTFNVLIT